MELNKLISSGSNADVYKYENIAIKVYHTDYSKTEVLNEALNTARVEETGLDIPCITEINKIKNNWAIKMNLIEGKTMAELIKENPNNTEKYISDMVDIQLNIHSKQSPLLNKLKDKMTRQINELDNIDDVKKYDLLTRLDGMPKHNKLCHGDFNPHNIIVTEKKSYVLDWVHASQGNASADAARTYLLFSLSDSETAEIYMDIFCKKSKTEKRYVQNWLSIVAAAQLSKKRPKEKELLTKWVDVIDFQ